MGLLVLDPGSSVPPYEQVRSQLAEAIEGGKVLPATRLPTVRRLAGDLGLAVNTVARAYRELELAGLIETRGRQGTFVVGPSSQAQKLATETAREYLGRMRDLGYDDAESVAIIRHQAEAGQAEAGPRTAPGTVTGPGWVPQT
ncbi:MAG TPA: GntR family transcriptional regulator [Trebonia sp.]|nr:GntR family transcriptional regulator [Trebonia sp.]